MTDKLIAVVGATGAQGGGLVRAIVGDPGGGFRARAITRDVHSDKAAGLAELGAEVVAADLDDEDSLVRAFDGAHGAYLVTAFWEHFSPEREKAQAANMASAAKAAEVEHCIWSTLEDTRKWVPLNDSRMPTLHGEYKVPHFDAKGESNRFFSDLGVPTTLFHTCFYWDNLINFGLGPKPGPDGTLVFALPMGTKKLPGIAAEDIGRCAYGIFKRGTDFIGESVGIAAEHPTGAQMAAALTRALGREVRYRAIPLDEYRRFDFPGAEDLANMFQFKQDFEDYYCGMHSVEMALELNPTLQSFDAWLARHGERIPLE